MMTPKEYPWYAFAINLSLPLAGYAVLAGFAYLAFYRLRPRDQAGPFCPPKASVRRDLHYSFLTILVFSGVACQILFMYLLGSTRIYIQVGERGWVYFFFSVAATVLMHDTYFYWTHRLMHLPAVYRRIHRLHHTTQPTPVSAFAFHPGEALVHAAFLPLLVVFMPLHWAAIAAFMLFMTAMNVLGHLGFEPGSPGFLRLGIGKVANTSTHHHMHHRNGRTNYGLYFRFWDRIMHTEDESYEMTYTHAPRRFPRKRRQH